MIGSFRDKWLRAFFVEDSHTRRIRSDLEERLFLKLQLIDDATADEDLRAPPSNRFEKLKGKLAGYCSIRVNKKWRLVFRWTATKAKPRIFISTTTVYR